MIGSNTKFTEYWEYASAFNNQWQSRCQKNCLYSVESEYNNHNIKIRFNRAEATETAYTYK